MKLFLSHASEDKDFVRQLYERLKAEGFDVWLDERNMTLGDSLLTEINKGLSECDYGVVVLSPTFFGMKWARAELGALMALETTTKKMILPVWKDLSAAQITELMPTLADRVAVDAAKGLDLVVQAIKSAVGGAERQRTMSRFDQIKARLDQAGATTKAGREAERLLNSTEGVKRLRAEATRFGAVLFSYFSALSSDEMKFTPKETHSDSWNVQAPKRYAAEIRFVEGASNVAAHAELHCVLYRVGEPKYSGKHAEPRVLSNLTFYPYFDGKGAAVWSPTNRREETMTTEDVLSLLAEKLTDFVTRD